MPCQFLTLFKLKNHTKYTNDKNVLTCQLVQFTIFISIVVFMFPCRFDVFGLSGCRVSWVLFFPAARIFLKRGWRMENINITEIIAAVSTFAMLASELIGLSKLKSNSIAQVAVVVLKKIARK